MAERSPGFSWVYGLVTIFGLGVLYIIFNYVFGAHLVPTLSTYVNTSTIDAATKAQIFSGYDKFIAFWNIMPFVLIFVIIIWMIIIAVRKEQVNY